MKLGNVSAFAVVTVLFAGAAVAQEQSSPSAPSPDQQAPRAPEAAAPSTSARSETSAASAPSAMNNAVNASAVTTRVITNGPIPDTPENRAAFGKPLSQAGRNSKPAGN